MRRRHWRFVLVNCGTTKIYLVNLGSSGAGTLSFPNLRGEDKPLQYVDLRILAEEAERAGIDLRLIYLARLARNIFLSDTQSRDFGGGELFGIEPCCSGCQL